MDWVRMKKSWNNKVIFLSIILILFGVSLAVIPKYKEMLSDPSEVIINKANEQLDSCFLTPENDTHYQNLTVIDEWGFGRYLQIQDIAVVGNITYLATGWGLVLYNTSDPAKPTFISKTSDFYSFNKISVSDELVFLRQSYGYRLIIVNCSDLLNPVIINDIVINELDDLIIEGDIGYLATSYTLSEDTMHSIQIYNFSDPLNPIRISYYNLRSIRYSSIEKQGDYLFCVSYRNTFAIFDVSDVLNPLLVVTVVTDEDYTELLVIDDLLYMMSRYTFQIWNISDIFHPTLCDTVYLSGAIAFSVQNNLAYIVLTEYFETEFLIYNVANPYVITFLTSYDNLLSQQNLIDSAIHTEGNIATVTCYDNGFVVLNISDYSNVTRITFEFSGYIGGIYRVDDYAILKYNNLGIKILNITDILNPRIISSTFIEGLYGNLFFEDDILYVFSTITDGLYIYNVSDLTSLKEISHFDYIYTVYELYITNGLAVLQSHDHFTILNVSDPSNPILLHESAYYQYIDEIAIYNEFIIIGYGYFTFTCGIFNISNPSSPVLVQQMALPLQPLNLKVNGTYLYVQNNYPHELVIYDIEDISNPVLIKQMTLSSYIYQYVIQNNLLYLFNRDTGIEIWELDSNDNFIFYGVLSTPITSFWSQTNSPAIDGNLFFLAFSDRILVIGLDSDDDSIADYLEINKYGTNPFDEDSDGDLMVDWYEISFDLDPLNGTDADLDYDGDNLTNYNESVVLTNPWLNDTDSDSLTDDLELFYGTNPLDSDTDNDILTDFEELFDYFTDPIDNDSDNDSLIDGYEILFYHTDPLNNDTDDDLMDDYFEVHTGLDPLFDDASFDLDLDGLSNYEEYLLGTYPNRSDSDYDGYSDFEEIEAGTDPRDSASYPDYPPHPLPTEPLSLFEGSLTIFLVLSASLYSLSKYRKKRRRNP